MVWVLLTNVPVTTYADLVGAAWTGTRARWLVEEFHKVQKTGCSIEDMQLGKENHDERGKPAKKNRLEPAIALLSVVAVQLLCLHQASRDERNRGPSSHGSVYGRGGGCGVGRVGGMARPGR